MLDRPKQRLAEGEGFEPSSSTSVEPRDSAMTAVIEPSIPPNWFLDAFEARLEAHPEIRQIIHSDVIRFWWHEFEMNVMPLHNSFELDLNAYLDQLIEFLRRRYLDVIRDRLKGVDYE